MSDTRDIYRSTGLPRLITEPFTTWIWTADGGYEVTVSPDQANAMVRAADADAAFLRGWRRADERRADVSETSGWGPFRLVCGSCGATAPPDGSTRDGLPRGWERFIIRGERRYACAVCVERAGLLKEDT